MARLNFITFLCLHISLSIGVDALLYPKDSVSRETKSLNGIWNFRPQSSLDAEQGFRDKWYALPLKWTGNVIDMPVPSSFNDITTHEALRDFVGWVWYDREFFVPQSWSMEKIFLRFGSAHYTAIVWINGQEAMEHVGGHLPFEGDISSLVSFEGVNRVTVALNNTLGPYTIPQGSWKWFEENAQHPPGDFEMQYTFDFFNYAGIHRPVTLYTVPKQMHISNLRVTTQSLSKDLSQATVAYTIEVMADQGDFNCQVSLMDHAKLVAQASEGCTGTFELSQPRLWWPFLMNDNYGYLYTLRAMVNSSTLGEDTYDENVGVRLVAWDNDTFQINHTPFYFRGFGRHEDSNFRGKGLDLALASKDYNLMRWMGANSYRTSHYPYAEELMDFADRNGIVVIDECPGVNLEGFQPDLLQNHLDVMDELLARDKNHPSVVMWSIGNEPRSTVPEAKDYFQTVADYVRSLDGTRPVTLVLANPVDKEEGGYSVDIIGLNRYLGWYSQTGHLELIANATLNDVRRWREKFGKPIIMTEYGADTIAGFHEVPATIYTEEYQVGLMKANFEAFDQLAEEGSLIGEMIWNFADFMTKQEYVRAWGNRKGIFTRDRHPKQSAHVLRERYWALATNPTCQSGLQGEPVETRP